MLIHVVTKLTSVPFHTDGCRVKKFAYYMGGSGKNSLRVWWGGWVSGAQILRFFPTYFGIFSEGKNVLSYQIVCPYLE